MRMTSMWMGVCGIVLVAAACGGSPKADTTPDMTSTPPETSGGSAATGDDAPADTSNMFAPEAIDQLQRALDRKRASGARCRGDAVDVKELPKNAHGKMTLEIVIAPSGSASSIKIIKTDLDSKTLAECVQKKVHEIAFPNLPKPYERSYTYGFEAM